MSVRILVRGIRPRSPGGWRAADARSDYPCRAQAVKAKRLPVERLPRPVDRYWVVQQIAPTARPGGAMDCSHGWNDAHGVAEPVEKWFVRFALEGQRRGSSRQVLLRGTPPPLAGRVYRYHVPRIAPARLTAARLHPWLQSCAPPGRADEACGLLHIERRFPRPLQKWLNTYGRLAHGPASN